MAAIDQLFDIRNSYYLGAYQQAINDAQNARVKTESETTERDAFLYRSYIALGKTSIPLKEIDANTSNVALRAVRRFADYTANPGKRAKITADVEAEVAAGIDPDDVNLLLAADILVRHNNIDDALRALHLSESLEVRASTIQCLLKLDRVDLAIREWKKMQEVNEDATITQLALAWVNMGAGKEKLQEAFYIYQEMIDNLIQQGKYAEAEKLLQDAQQRSPSDPDVLVNLLVVSTYLGKAPEVVSRYINQLKDEHQDHPWVLDFIANEKAFDRAAQETVA